MNPLEAFECMKIAALAKVPVFLEGNPGVAKSALARQLAEYFHIPPDRVFDERATLNDPTDIKGFPEIKEELTHWRLPAWLPKDTGQPCMIVVDEITTAAKLTQASYFQLAYDRTVGHTYTLPEDTILVFAGNPVAIGAVATMVPSPLASRWMRLEITANVQAFLQWATRNGSPKKAKNPFKPLALSHITSETRSFIRFKGSECLDTFDPKAYMMGSQKSYACPRTHELADKIVQVCDKVGASQETMFHCLEGLLGQDVASQRISFRKLAASLPDPVMILADPLNAEVPTDFSVLITLTTSLVDMLTESNAENFMVYAQRLPEEYQAKLVKTAEKDPRAAALIHATFAYPSWAARFTASI